MPTNDPFGIGAYNGYNPVGGTGPQPLYNAPFTSKQSASPLPGPRAGGVARPTSGGLYASAYGYGHLPTRYDQMGPTLLDGSIPGTSIDRTRPWLRRNQQRRDPYATMGPMEAPFGAPMFGNMPQNQLMQALSGLPRFSASTFGPQGGTGFRIPRSFFNFTGDNPMGSLPNFNSGSGSLLGF